MTRILIHSPAPYCPTGYGQQTAQLARRLKKAGYDVEISAHYGLEGAFITWEGIRVWPGANDMGDRMLHQYIEARSPDLVITLQDVHTLDAEKLRGAPLAAWVPIDHEPLGGQIGKWLTESDAIPIAMSRHGEKQLTDVGFPCLYAPHGIDTRVFSPVPRGEAREAFGVPQSAFLIAMVAANMDQSPSRKAWVEALEAFKIFHERHEDAILYMHTSLDGTFGGGVGVTIPHLCDALGIPPENDWIMGTERLAYEMGLPAEALASLYSAADVLLAPSYGEGFGIPPVEAQACGTPVIVSDFSAQTELCGAGWLVEGAGRHWINPYQAWWQRPSVESIVECLERAYVEAEGMSERAVEFAQAYDADRVFAEFWRPILDKLAPLPSVALPNRAARRRAEREKAAV